MSETTVSQSTQFSVKELSLLLSNGQSFDITKIFDELNLFDNLFTPCVSGNILISEAINISEKLKFDGNEKIKIKIDKGDTKINSLRYEKEFVVYKLTNKKNINQTSQSYVLHFVSEEFVLSEQKKVFQTFKGLYSNFVEKILQDYLKVKKSSPSNGKAGIGLIYPTTYVQDVIIPSISPFDAINWISKRSISSNTDTPDYVFWETQQLGYSFVPISYLMRLPSRFELNFKPKNIDNNMGDEFLGVRDLKILSQFSLIDTIRDGSYAGKFIGFDTLTRTFTITKVENVFDTGVKSSSGQKSNLTDALTKENVKYNQMYDSRIVAYPFATPRRTTKVVETDNPALKNFIDNTEGYVFQRKAIFSNLMQRRLQLALPGNFALYSGTVIDLKVPKYAIKEEGGKEYDASLSGKYIITGTRHMIKYDKHETFLEVATDKVES